MFLTFDETGGTMNISQITFFVLPAIRVRLSYLKLYHEFTLFRQDSTLIFITNREKRLGDNIKITFILTDDQFDEN